MSAYDYVGADGGSDPEGASRAVTSASRQSPALAYGYLRAGAHQRVYLFQTPQDGHGWFESVAYGQSPYDYVAVFAAADLSRPAPGLESFGHTAVSGDAYVGQWPLFLLGAMGGGAAGYFLRRWQEQNPGRALPLIPPGKLTPPTIPPSASAPPKASGDYVGGPWLDVVGPQVGGPWLDMVGPQVGGPWLDVVGPQVGGPWLDVVGHDDDEAEVSDADIDALAQELSRAFSIPMDRTRDQLAEIACGMGVGASYGADADAARRRAWYQTRALIESAKREVVDYNASSPAAAWVWSLDPSGPSSVPGVQLTGGTTAALPFSSYALALDYMRSRAQAPHVALALFDTASPHWPSPVSWTKSDDPVYAPIIAQHVAESPRLAGSYVGGTVVGNALDDLRSRAESLAAKRAGSVIGVIHTPKDGLWHTLAFRAEDDADDWLDTATQDPASYTYASYFNKSDPRFWPHAVIEKVSGMRSPPGTSVRRPAVSGRWAA